MLTPFRAVASHLDMMFPLARLAWSSFKVEFVPGPKGSPSLMRQADGSCPHDAQLSQRFIWCAFFEGMKEVLPMTREPHEFRNLTYLIIATEMVVAACCQIHSLAWGISSTSRLSYCQFTVAPSPSHRPPRTPSIRGTLRTLAPLLLQPQPQTQTHIDLGRSSPRLPPHHSFENSDTHTSLKSVPSCKAYRRRRLEF
jgi:hypothetical protein